MPIYGEKDLFRNSKISGVATAFTRISRYQAYSKSRVILLRSHAKDLFRLRGKSKN